MKKAARLPRPSELLTPPAASDPLRVPKGLLLNFFDATALEVGRAGFRRARRELVAGLYLTAAARVFPLNITDVQAHAARYGLTATLDRLRNFVVFRRLWPPAGDEALRASGEVVCEVCGYKLYDHPPDATFPFLNVGCDGRRFKL